MNGIPRPLVRVNQWFIFIFSTAFVIFLNPIFLIIPLINGLLSLIFKLNPVMKIGKLFLKKPMNSYIPEDKEQQEFNQRIAVILLAIGLTASVYSWEITAIISAAMVALSSAIAILGFCIGCFIRFQWKKFQYKRTQHSN